MQLMWKQFSPAMDELDIKKLRDAATDNPEGDFKHALRQLEREADGDARRKKMQKGAMKGSLKSLVLSTRSQRSLGALSALNQMSRPVK